MALHSAMRFALLVAMMAPGVTTAVKPTVLFDNIPTGPVPHDAAFHHRAAVPEAALHMVTQHVNNDLRAGRNESKGTFESVRPHYDLLMHFSIGLHEDLAPLDDLAVSHFVHRHSFHMDTTHDRVRVGTILAGTHHGNWSLSAGSSRALAATTDTSDHSFGGFAYLQRVTAVETLADGKIQVETTDDVPEKVFTNGRIALAWNHTWVNMTRKAGTMDEDMIRDDLMLDSHKKRDTDNLDDDSQRQLVGNPLDDDPGICDASQDECYEEASNSLYLDRIGGCASWTGYCNDDDDYYWNGGSRSNDDSELCAYCFEYHKVVDAFRFNYDSSSGGAATSPYYPVNSVSEVKCTECWAYVGATAFFVFNWEGWSVGDLEAGVSGTAGFNFELEVETATFSKSDEEELYRDDECIGTIVLYSFVYITPKCVLEADSVTAADFEGSMTFYSSFYASREIGFHYNSGAWSKTDYSAWSYTPPSVQYSFNSGDLDMDFTLRPKVEIEISLSFAGVASVTATSSVSLTPNIHSDLVGSGRRLSEQCEGVLLPGTPLLPGRFALLNMTVDQDIQHATFRLMGDCWDGMFITIQDTSFTRMEQSPRTVLLPLPWHELLTMNPCSSYMLTARSAHDKSFAIESEPFRIHIPDVCQRSVVTAPADGELIQLDQQYTFRWDSTQLFFYMKGGPAHEGRVTPVERVQLMLLGTHLLAEGEECPNGHDDRDDGTCVEATWLTPMHGTTNHGEFTFDWTTGVDGHGEKLSWNGTWWDGRYHHVQLQITAQGHSPITVMSRGRSYLSANTTTLSNTAPLPWCSDQASSGADGLDFLVPPAGIPMRRAGATSGTAGSTDEVESGGGGRRRLSSDASLSATGSLGMEANFDSVDLSFMGYSASRVWEDTDDSEPTAQAVLVSEFSIIDDSIDYNDDSTTSTGDDGTSSTGDDGTTSTVYTSSFESDFDGWTTSTFLRDASGTPSSSTGPSGAYDGSYYVYAETSNPNFPGVEFSMYRDFSGDVASVSFQYSMYGATMGTALLQGSDDGGSTYTTLWSKSGDQGDAWYSADVSISSTYPHLLEFAYTSGSGYTGDFALDNVEVTMFPVPTREPTPKPSSRPTAKPSPKPSSPPSAKPTAKPSPNPSSRPTAKPSPNPSSPPSAKPTEKPSPKPSSPLSAKPTAKPSLNPSLSAKPTANPSPKPSSPLSAKPTAKPSPKPSSIPSAKPTVKPSPKPTLSAEPTVKPWWSDSSSSPSSEPTVKASPVPSSIPSDEPTAKPSIADTVGVSASMTFEGFDASAVTDDDITAIKSGLAKVLDGVNASHISDVSVADASTRRRGRSLLGTAATVSFTVQVSLAETTFASASELENTVSSTLSSIESDSSNLIAKIKATASSSAKWDDVTGVSDTATAVLTRSPSALPSFAPFGAPSLAPSLGVASDISSKAADASGMLVGAIVAITSLGLGGVWKYRRNRNKQKGSKLRVEKEGIQGPPEKKVPYDSIRRGSIDLISPGGHQQRLSGAAPPTDAVDYEIFLCNDMSIRESSVPPTTEEPEDFEIFLCNDNSARESSIPPTIEESEDSLAVENQAPVEFQI